MLQRQFERDIKRRMVMIRRAIVKLVVELDVFGLIPVNVFAFNVHFPQRQAWRFQTDTQKLGSFRTWLASSLDEELLTVTAVGEPWTATYINSAYRQGTVRAFNDARGAAGLEQAGFIEGTKSEFLRSAFAQPERLEKVRLLSTRAFEEMRGISTSMSQQLNRDLAAGLVSGQNPRQLARTMSQSINGLARRRAAVIARTEIIHAHSEGQLDSFEDLGIDEIGILAEWSTAGDDRVCPQCAALEGELLTVKEARGLIPRHPNCRCAWIPASVVDRRKRRANLVKAANKSLRAERPTADTLADARRASTWLGKGL